MQTPPFQTSPENAAIIEKLQIVLSETPIDGTVTYTILSRVAGVDIAVKHRSLLDIARKRSEKELRCVFATVRGIGVKRLTAEESVEIGPPAISSIRRKSNGTARRIEHLSSSNSLSDTSQKRAIAYSSMLRAIGMMADNNKARVIAAIVNPANPIPPKDILKMFEKPEK